jgi:putative selenium metabolism protein SsnA
MITGKIPGVERPIALRRARIVLDLAAETVREDAGIAVQDGKIALVGTTADVDRWTSEHAAESPEVVDLAGKVVLPGLINAHTHLYSTLARGMPLVGAAPADFKQILERIWWPLDRALEDEDVYLSALVGLAEHARAGVTTVVDHHASEGAIEGSLDLVARAARELGLRVSTCFEVTDRDGQEVARRGIEENVRFARTERGSLGGVAQVVPTFGLHAALTLSDETLERAKDARATSGLRSFHVHVAESRFDPSAVERLASRGVLTGQTIAAHCVHVSDRERAILKDTGTLVVTNPSSNRNNAVGRADLSAHLRAGVPIAVGTDGMSPDILGEAAQVFLGQKGDDPRGGWAEAQAALAGTKRVADSLFGRGLGAVTVGGPADLALLDYEPWTPFESWLSHVLYGGLGARVASTLCGGRWVHRDGRFPASLDLERATARARERARSLWRRRKVP